MKIVELYKCEICGTEYRERKEAEECEAQGTPALLANAGDIVLADSGFTWFDGDKRWIENPEVVLKTTGAKCPNGDSNCFDECCTYQFYYVVTAVDIAIDSRHRTRYHLATKAMAGETGHARGYTLNVDHLTPRKVNDPPRHVVTTSKDLVGARTERLL